MFRAGTLRRGLVDQYVTQHVVAWEGVMGVLAVAYLAIDILIDGGNGVPVPMIAFFTTVFLGEFLLRLVDARSRIGYLRGHWLDLVSCMPLVGGLRAFRLLRLLRLIRATRAVGAIERHKMYREKSSGPGVLFAVLLMVWFGAAICFWTLEHDTNPDARTFGDALFWAFMTMTTVGYGSNSGLHAETRVLEGAMIFVGIGMVSLVSGHIAARLLNDDEDKITQARLDEIAVELRRLRLAMDDREEVRT